MDIPNSLNQVKPKGKFICVEGADNTGKTTLCKKISDILTSKGKRVKLFSFPNYGTPSGKLIKKYLHSNIKLEPEVLHLLFSANRYESIKILNKLLSENDYLICDRYCYSGIVYSITRGLDEKWCKDTDRLLLEKLKPDLLIYLSVALINTTDRKQDFIDIDLEFQKKIMTTYKIILPDDTHNCLISEIDSLIIKILNIC